MSEEKCFCHLNGYKVKDADARARIAEMETAIKAVENADIAGFDLRITSAHDRIDALEKEFTEKIYFTIQAANGTRMYEVRKGATWAELIGDVVFNYHGDFFVYTLTDGTQQIWLTDIENGETFEPLQCKGVDVKPNDGVIDGAVYTTENSPACITRPKEEVRDINHRLMDLEERITALEQGAGSGGSEVVPTDHEDRITALEDIAHEMVDITDHEERITALEQGAGSGGSGGGTTIYKHVITGNGLSGLFIYSTDSSKYTASTDFAVGITNSLKTTYQGKVIFEIMQTNSNAYSLFYIDRLNGSIGTFSISTGSCNDTVMQL